MVAKERVHCGSVYTLSSRYFAILVGEENGLEINNLFAELGDGCLEVVVLGAVELNLALQIGQPLLLALPAFECSDPACMLA